MALTGLTVALAAAFCWAGLDATRKRLVQELAPEAAAMWLHLAQAPVFAAWAALGAATIEVEPYLAPGGGGLALQVVANVLLMKALSVSPLSATIPFLSFTPVFTSLVAYGWLGEEPSAGQWAGVALVVLGALGLHARRGQMPWRSLVRERGSVMALGVAACWSVSPTLDKMALEHAPLPLHASIQTAGVGVSLLAWLALRRAPLSIPRPAWPSFASSVAFALGALALQLWAIQLLLVGLVEALKRGVGMSSAVVVGRLRFDEPVDAAKIVGVALMAAGSALVILSG